MRKISIFVILLILCFCTYYIIEEGFELGSFETVTIDDLAKQSKKLNSSIKDLEKLNTTKYNDKKKNLTSSVKEYQTKKTQYESLIPEMQAAVQESESISVDLYDIDFLWTIIGNYATEEGVTLKFDVTKNVTTLNNLENVNNNDYVFCDLNFTVSGEYITITDFIYDLEDDDRLKFEISDFKLVRGGTHLQATFVVKSVPINSKNLSVVSSTTTATDTTNTNTTSGNTDSSSTTNTVKK